MSRRQILTVPSPDPISDFKFVLKLFPGVFDNNDEIYLLENKFTVMMFVPTELDRNVHVVTWSTDTTFPVESSSPTELKRIALGSLELCEILLPSGTTLVQCPLEMTSAECRKLAVYLRNRSNDEKSDVTQKDGAPFVLPAFPTLDVQLLGANGSYHPFPLNSPTAIPIETELFRGKILVLLRPPNPQTDDPFWNERIFSGRQRRIVIQIQGSFLRKPRGVVYAGAQISDPMKLGLITRGVCSVLLRLVESFKKDVHYSYGSAEESAHIVAPAYSFFERVAVTEPGETPPNMEETFPESNESMALRKSAKTFEWNTTDTYSFSFYSMYIDLVRWKLVNIPATGDLSLQTFWGHSMLNICMYERDGSGSQHLDRNNNYVFSVRARYLGDTPQESDESRRGEGSDTESIALLPWSERNVGTSTGSLPETSFMEVSIGRSESQVFTSLDLSRLSPIRYSDEPVIIREEHELNFFDAEQGREENTMSQQETMSPSELLKLIDATCPFWIDVHRGQGSTTLFAVNKDNTTSFRKSNSCEELVRGVMNSTASRRVKPFSPRLSQLERLRRSLGICLSFQETTSFSGTDPINEFHEDSDNNVACLPKGSTVRTEGVLLAGMVGRALSDRHWVVERAMISDDKKSMLFYRNAEKRRHHFQVKLSTISAIDRMGEDLAPLTFGYYVLALTTIGRTLYIMLGSEEDCEAWRCGLKELVQKASMTPLEGGSSIESNVLRLFDIENIASEFMHNSSMWRCKNRRLLNCGKFHFREGNALSLEAQDPVAVVSEALRSTLAAQAEGLEDAERRRGFLDSVTKLKAVSIEDIGEEDKLVFFLNLYHVMVSHAFLILGPPDSSLKWFKYFNVVAYQVNDDIFSLSELEHCIIRSNMTYPSQLFSKFVIPKTKFKIALTSTNDFRINFALNCGSLSIPSTVAVYDVCRIEEQLDEASRLYLYAATSRLTTSGTLILNLPRVVQWFADDFGEDQASRLESVRRLLPEEIQTSMATASRVEVKFQPFSFECRPISLQTAPKASKNISSSTT